MNRSLKKARWLWMPLIAFAITRLSIMAVAYFSMPILADSNVPPYHTRPDNLVLDTLGSRWDTGFYLSIAEEGYRYQGVPLPSVAFFPFLPMLIRAISVITRDPLWAGVLAANLALAAASVLFYRLVRDRFDDRVADRSVWYLLIFPASIFGSAIYTESIFLLLCITAFLLARSGRWWAAGFVGVLAGMTRLVGLILIPALLLEWWSMRRSNQEAKPVRTAWRGLLAAFLPVLGVLAYMLYLNWTVGDPLAFMHASAAWGRQPTSPVETVAQMITLPAGGWRSALASGALPLDNWLDLLFVGFFLAIGIVLLARRQWGEAVFVLMGVAIPISSGLLMSQRRYMWVLFPAFIVLALWGENRWVDRVVTTASLMGLSLFTAMFANWYWVG